MCDPIYTVHSKVSAIFTELVGDLARRLDGAVMAEPAMSVIADAYIDEYGLEKADELALNIADWNSDAAFIVALHLFPDRFTVEEIRAGIDLMLVHVPYHIREACRLTGQ